MAITVIYTTIVNLHVYHNQKYMYSFQAYIQFYNLSLEERQFNFWAERKLFKKIIQPAKQKNILREQNS